MVKNTIGGKGAKKIARKTNFSSSFLRLPSNSLELFAFIDKPLGNSMLLSFVPILPNPIIAHIRNKFKGKHKRGNLITPNSIVLVGLREWENPPKNCDILYVYDDNEIELLKNNPQVDIRELLQRKMNNELDKHSEEVDNIVFTNDITEEINITTNTTTSIEEFELDISEEINIDDI